jgi:hypothetical protein
VPLLVKNLGRGMPESVVREELQSLNIRVQGVMQFRSGRRDQDPAKDRPPKPHFIVSVARGPEVSRVRSLTELCGLRVSMESYVAPKGPLQCKRFQRFGHTQRNCGYAPRCVACGGTHLSGGCSYLAGTASVLRLRMKPHGELSGLCKVERGESCPFKASARASREVRRHGPPRRSGSPADRSRCRAEGTWRRMEPRRPRGRVVKATTPPLTQIPLPSMSRKRFRNLK